MSPIQREVDHNGIEHTFFLGADVRALAAIGVVIGVLAVYIGPIIAVTIYLQNLYVATQANSDKIGSLRTDINPKQFDRLTAEVERINKLQVEVLQGNTTPQVLGQEKDAAFETRINSMEAKFGKVTELITGLQRQIDRLTYDGYKKPNGN